VEKDRPEPGRVAGTMRRHVVFCGLLAGLASGWGVRDAGAQGPTIDSSLPDQPGAGGSVLGPAPGSGGGSFANTPGANQGILSGRPGPTSPRVNPDTTGTTTTNDLAPGRIAPLAPLANADLPIYGSLARPSKEDVGPPDGLTLDRAIDLMIRNNIDLRSKFYELPQAQADILTASLRANPVFYADAQLIPYGQYTKARPGGQTQYDVNVSIPLDVSRKRRARTVAAVEAKRVLEAQYQDAVRLAIDNLYTVYVNVLAARETIALQEESLKGLVKLEAAVKRKFEGDFSNQVEYNQVVVQLGQARIALDDARLTLRKSKIELANQLNLDPGSAEEIQVRGTILDKAPLPPAEDEMIRTVLASRPDVVANRLGISSATANVKLQKANRLQDVYLLYQPYTLQDNTPFGLKSPTSWALGVTVPLPIFNRNQGAIRRAELNVTQTRLQLNALERQAIRDMQQAEREYSVSRDAVEQFEQKVLPPAEQAFALVGQRYTAGEASAIEVLSARKDLNDTIRLYRDALVRHRRAMLDLNTALGQRVLP